MRFSLMGTQFSTVFSYLNLNHGLPLAFKLLMSDYPFTILWKLVKIEEHVSCFVTLYQPLI